MAYIIKGRPNDSDIRNRPNYLLLTDSELETVIAAIQLYYNTGDEGTTQVAIAAHILDCYNLTITE